MFQPHLSESMATLALGGDNYSLDYGGTVRYFQANNAVLDNNKPLVLWGASVGPFSKNQKFERYAAKELKKVSLICARESETIHYLASIGVADNVRPVADPAFVLEPSAIENVPPELEVIRRPCIGMNFSPLMARYWSGSRSWEECAAECIKQILKRFDLPVVLIPHVVYPNNDDHLLMQKIINHLDISKERLTLIDRNYNAQQLKWIISQMELFIGCRTHSTIASLSSEVPTLSIGYSMKARGINKDIFGHHDWLVPLDELQPEFLTEKAATLLNAKSEVKDHFNTVMPAYKKRARAAGQYLKELLLQSSEQNYY